jgi:hypothetical protein
MCPGCCPGIGMGVTPTMNTHKGNMGIAVPCSRREHKAILPESSSFREPGACTLRVPGEPHGGDGQAGLQIK